MSAVAIMAIFVVETGSILPSSVPTIIAQTPDEQEELASEFARFMHGWVHKLSNGIIIVTRE